MQIDSPICTPRLEMKNLDAGNVSPHYLHWLHDPDVNRFLEIRHAPPASAEELLAFVDKVNMGPDSLLLGIFHRGDARHIGNIKLGPMNIVHKRADLGFLIGEKAYWGAGYASEAISALAEYAFAHLPLEKLTAGCYAENVASAKTLSKAGFHNDARLPAHAMFDGRRVDVLLFGRLKQGAA